MTVQAAGKTGDSDVRQPAHPEAAQEKRYSIARWAKVFIGALVVIVLAYVGYQAYQNSASAPKPNTVSFSGRIEADETHILAATGTRVSAVKVNEGDTVHKGQLLVSLDSQKLGRGIQTAKKALNQAQVAEQQANVQVQQAQKNIDEAKKKSKGFFAKVFSTKKGREKKVEELRTDMVQAKFMSYAAQSSESQAKAAISQVSSKSVFFKLTSPINGVVSVRSVEPGEIVGQGQVLLTVYDPSALYMRGFVSEEDLAKIKIGQKAMVSVGADGEKRIQGKIVSIDSKASFTPQNVYFKNDRLRQSFGLKIALNNADGRAKPGMGAEAEIELKSRR